MTLSNTVFPAPAYVRRRSSYKETLDDFPTPPWAVRTFFRYVAQPSRISSYWDPACGRGHVVHSVKEWSTSKVHGSDVKDYGYGYRQQDFLNDPVFGIYDYHITNPPFKLGEEFVLKSLSEARCGVAILIRTLFLEGAGRNQRLFSKFPPTKIAVFSKRIPCAENKVIQYGAMYTSHTWVWWNKVSETWGDGPKFLWIPPEAQATLERPGDYDDAFLRGK